MVESLLSTVIAEASKAILEKVKRGKRLSMDEILLLYLDLVYTRIGGVREEMRELNRRMDTIHLGLSRKIDELNKRIDETNRRIDRLYELLVGKRGRA